ncbi:MAG TPA: MarR family transcriptional regulator, partial [Thermomicrobiales bacterium]|nr:MarR family transcriptional regulator [Thermomicrobiales bacterium]
MPAPSAEAVREVQVLLSTLFSEGRRFMTEVARTVHPDLSPSGFYLLRMLEKCGPSRPSTLAAHLEVDRSAMSRLIQGLDELGLIQRTPDPQDRRAYMLDLTAEGRERLARVRTAENPIARALQDWDETDVR